MSASSKKQLRKEQTLAALTEKQLQEKKEAKKLKIYTISFILVIALVVGIGAALIVRNTVVNSGIMQKTTAAQIGEHKLSAVDLNYFYVDYIQEFYNSSYNQYSSMTDTYLGILYGLNTAAPLDQQFYDDEGKVTWAEFFANQAVKDAAAIYAVYDEAVSKGFTLSEEDLNTIDSELELSGAYAQIYGYKNLNEYLKAVYGAGSSEESYRSYKILNATAQHYYSDYSASLTYSDTDLREHEKEHYDEFNSYSYSYFFVDAKDFLTGGTTGEDGKVTYSEEETAASVEAAKAAAEALVASGAADVDALKDAIKATEQYADLQDTDITSLEDTLYSSVTAVKNITAADILKWLSGDERKAGDLTMFADEYTTTAEDGTETKTTNGYIVMIFEGVKDNTMELMNVRHILFKFEGGTTDSSTNVTTYSEAEKQAAKDKATAMLETYQNGKQFEEVFATLAKENSEDSSASNGGLIEDVYPGQMVENFDNWCFDESRKPGDVDIVESEYGYHVMYYVGTTGTTFRDFMIENTLRNEDVSEWYTALVNAVKSENVKIKYLNLDYIINPSQQ